MKKANNQENYLPLLAQMSGTRRKLYTDKNSKADIWEKFSMEELGERLEHDLLQIPDFQPPYTTASNPARLLSCEVVSEPDERGVLRHSSSFSQVIKVNKNRQLPQGEKR